MQVLPTIHEGCASLASAELKSQARVPRQSSAQSSSVSTSNVMPRPRPVLDRGAKNLSRSIENSILGALREYRDGNLNIDQKLNAVVLARYKSPPNGPDKAFVATYKIVESARTCLVEHASFKAFDITTRVDPVGPDLSARGHTPTPTLMLTHQLECILLITPKTHNTRVITDAQTCNV
jgi:hypothetical protein